MAVFDFLGVCAFRKGLNSFWLKGAREGALSQARCDYGPARWKSREVLTCKRL